MNFDFFAKLLKYTKYAYCNDNPIMYIDPDGQDHIYAKDGFLFWRKLEKIGDDGQHSTGSYLLRTYKNTELNSPAIVGNLGG